MFPDCRTIVSNTYSKYFHNIDYLYLICHYIRVIKILEHCKYTIEYINK